MNETIETKPNRTLPRIRGILGVLALLTSPLCCCGATWIMDSLPPSMLPGDLNFIFNLFEGEAKVENRTGETLYLTAITTTYADPRVIIQTGLYGSVHIPVKPGESVALSYDTAD